MGYVLFDEAETTGEKVVLTAASYAYDEKGNLSQVNGDTVPETFGSPAYDVTALSPSNFTYTRLENSSLIASVVGPTHSVTNTYEQNRNVLSSKQNKITVGVNSNGTVSQYDYTSNSIGQRVARGQSGIAFSQSSSDTFSYNTRGEVVNSSNNQTALYNRSYSYDAIGNRTTYLEGEQDAPVNSFTYSSNSLGQYTEIQKTSSVPPSVETLAYDEDGNVLSIGSGAAYQWDCENRLVKIISGSNAINFAYDGIGRRVEKKFISPAGTVTTTYFYDNCNLIYEKAQTQGVESSTWKTYVWGLDLSNSLYGAGGVGGLLSATIHGDGMSRHSFLFDGNGNVSEVLSGAGEVLAHYEYDAFGNTIFNSNATFENSFRFATKAFDVETNLYYYGYRFYVPSLGRWLSRDPMEEGLHFLLPLFKAYLDPMKNAFSSYYDSAMYLSSYNSMINTYDILGLSGQESNCRSGSNTLSFELPGVFNTLAKFLGGGISIEMYHSVNFTHCDLCCPNGESGTSDTVTTALGISFSGEVPISFPPLPGGFGLVLQLSLSAQGGSEFKYDSCTGEKTENGCFSLSWSAAAGACAPQSSSAPIRMCITCGVSQTYTKCIGESPQNEISGTCKVSFKTWFSTTEFTLYP
jgi:RHS repeat-associated protein